MTKEEAKQVFLSRGFVEVEGGTIYDADKWREACVVISKWLKQESCEDCISRQSVLEEAFEVDTKEYGRIEVVGVDAINSLPPVTPQEPKTGHWEYVQYDYNPKLGNWHCSECRCVAVECVNKEEKGGIPLYKYCPQCGAKMIELQAESDRTCRTCKHYTSGQRDGSCGSYICKHYSGWESEE